MVALFRFITLAIVIIIIAALAAAAVAAVAAAMAAFYAIALPLSFLLTVALLLRHEPETGFRQDEEPSRDDGEGERIASDQAGWAELPFARPERHTAEDDLLSLLTPPHLGRTRQTAWTRGHADQEVARPSYFFGPVVDDLVDVTNGYLARCRACMSVGIGFIAMLTEDEPSAPGLVIAGGVVIGMVAGGIVGSVVTAAIGMLNFMVTLSVAGVALAAGAVLYSLGRISRLVAGILMPCPECHEKITRYPIYLCPRCSEKHRDIGPGPCGMAVRNCACGARMPTSLLTGAGKLAAECPHCHRLLPSRFGVMPEIVIPVFGSVNVGKTQLMYTLARALESLVTAGSGILEFEGDTADRLNILKEDLATKGRPDKTIRDTPSAYLMRIKIGFFERRVFIFDAAGEMHFSPDGVRDLNYLDKARVFVFVVDPLASDALWAQIPEELRARLGGMRSSRSESELAYQQTRERMLDLHADTKHASLAIVLSKSDILEEAGIKLAADEGQPTLADWFKAESGMDMGNMMRAAHQGFATVRFFQTAALTSEAGVPDRSVELLARWLMRSEGINFRERISYGA